MRLGLFLTGLAIWLGATLFLRFSGLPLLHPGDAGRTLLLFAISFPLMGMLVRRLCRRLPRAEWPAGAISVALPTLLLDPFSSAFFPVAFPNMPPDAAGIFGGWMLCCCAGALAGALIGRRTQA